MIVTRQPASLVRRGQHSDGRAGLPVLLPVLGVFWENYSIQILRCRSEKSGHCLQAWARPTVCLVGSDQCRIYRSWSWRVGQKSVDYWFCVTLALTVAMPHNSQAVQLCHRCHPSQVWGGLRTLRSPIPLFLSQVFYPNISKHCMNFISNILCKDMQLISANIFSMFNDGDMRRYKWKVFQCYICPWTCRCTLSPSLSPSKLWIFQ